jgi:alkyl hydroperoxide reductase subunit AhpC
LLWADDIKETQGYAPNYRMIADINFNVSKLYDMLPASTSVDVSTRTAADNQTVRNVFVIGPDKKIKLILVYPMGTGRNFQEILRAIDSLQLTAKHAVSSPADWIQGEDVIISGSVTDEHADGEARADRSHGRIERFLMQCGAKLPLRMLQASRLRPTPPSRRPHGWCPGRR